MRVFVTGATGHIGSALVPELLQAGHQVTGLARSDKSAAALAAMGAEAHRGDIADLDGLRAAASAADDEDRQIGPGAQRAHDGEPVLVRKIEIEEDAVEAGTRHTAEGVASMGHKGGFVSRSIEIGRHDGAERRIIFDNQQSGFAWHGHDRYRLVFGTLW